MKYLIILSLLGLFACEKEKLPTTPTVINGSVVDENENPVPNLMLFFYGYEIRGFRGDDVTFNINQVSDRDGFFTFSQVIPEKTDEFRLFVEGVIDDSTGLPRLLDDFHYTYFLNDQLVPIGSIQVSKSKNLFGKTLTVKIKQAKR
jgi:hypothetical protein